MQKQVDKIVISISIVFLISLIGMIINVWELVYYPIPIITILLMILSYVDRLKESIVVRTLTIFSLVTLVAFILAGFGITDTNQSFWGLSLGAGILVYIIWPLSAMSGIVYAIMHK